MTRYLSVPEVVAINAEVVRKFGGTHAVRDGGLLDSAVARPQSGYYADVFEEAAALFESLSQNHPFVDGNKRTAITATGVFLLLNGFKLLFNDLEAYDRLIGLYEAGKVSKANIEPWLSGNTPRCSDVAPRVAGPSRQPRPATRKELLGGRAGGEP